MKLIHINESLAQRHYAVHEGKPFYEPLIEYITSSPVVVMVLEGNDAIEIVRRTMGATNPAEAAPGTIRADFALEIGRNLVHGSDGPETAAREVSLFFDEQEILSYGRDTDPWILE
jgi:nucleoside-diphosphate kinase